jgi:UDP-N-acetylmuramyl pentapeptide phosphotransferase/UDP-N-acetylglucosamine-1-phosphate transferase
MISYLKYISLDNELILAIAFLLSLLITYFSIPSIRYITVKNGLVPVPTDRCSHTKSTPVFGGVGIFIGVILTITLYSSIFESKNFSSLIAAIIILFFMGVKDDIHMLSAKKKFVGQIIASLIVILISDIRIASFHGVFGIHLLNYYLSIFVTLFVFLLIINAYNIVDGIDGLAGSIGILFSLGIGIAFYTLGQPEYALISFSLTGALVSFLYYNFSTKKKIFMGDTGSMIVGFLIAYLTIIAFSFAKSTLDSSLNLTIILISLFFYPLIDTLRIVLIRLIILKKSPFHADSNHIHHRLISIGLKHWEATLLLSSITIILLASSCLLNNLNINLQIFVTIVMGVFFYSLPFLLFNLVANKKTIHEYQK